MLIVQQKNVQHLEVSEREREKHMVWCMCSNKEYKGKDEKMTNTLTWSLMHTVMCCVFVASSEGEIKNNILMLLWKY